MSHPWKVSGLAVVTALAVLAPSIPAASAAMTHSSASIDNAFGFEDQTAPTPAVRHLTATSDGNSGDPVDIACMQGATRYFVMESTTLGAGGSLAYDVAEGSIGPYLCRIAVVNPGVTTADPTAFSGPTVGGGYFNAYAPNGHVNDFYIDHAYATSYADYYSLGACGLCDTTLLNADGQRGAYMFYGNAYLNGTHSEPGGGTRPDLVIDGSRAYTPFEADDLPLTVTHTRDPVTGDMTYTEEEDLVACAPDEATCTSYAQTAIHWKRVAVQNHGGRVVRFTDTLTNTDTANSHDYDVDFEQYQNSSGHNGFRFPGESGYSTHVGGDVISSGFGPVSTIGLVRDMTNASTGVANPLGTLTVSPQPVRALFASGNLFNLQFKGTIPAGGSQVINQTFSMGESQAEVDAYAAQAEDPLSPSVAFTAPADGATVSATPVTVTGTASDNKGVASLKVNGADATVAGDGTWSASVPLTEGANTLTAVAKDAAGNEASATRSITYTKPASTPPPPVVAVFATVSKNGKVKVTRKGSKVTVDTGIKVTCPAGSSSCTAAVDVKTLKAVAAKLKKSKITIAKKTFTIAAGTTKKIVLTLSSKGAKALKRNKKLTVKVTVVAKVGAGAAKTTTRTITIKYPKKG